MSAAVEAVRGAADALQGLAEDQDADLAGLSSAVLQQCCSSVPAEADPCWDALSLMASAFASVQPKVPLPSRCGTLVLCLRGGPCCRGCSASRPCFLWPGRADPALTLSCLQEVTPKVCVVPCHATVLVCIAMPGSCVGSQRPTTSFQLLQRLLT